MWERWFWESWFWESWFGERTWGSLMVEIKEPRGVRQERFLQIARGLGWGPLNPPSAALIQRC